MRFFRIVSTAGVVLLSATVSVALAQTGGAGGDLMGAYLGYLYDSIRYGNLTPVADGPTATFDFSRFGSAHPSAMNAVFAETFYFIALLNPGDKDHTRAVEFTRGFSGVKQAKNSI